MKNTATSRLLREQQSSLRGVASRRFPAKKNPSKLPEEAKLK